MGKSRSRCHGHHHQAREPERIVVPDELAVRLGEGKILSCMRSVGNKSNDTN